MGNLIKFLLATCLTNFGHSAAEAKDRRPEPLKNSVLTYIHSASPEVAVDLATSQKAIHQGLYSYESFVFDLSKNDKKLAKDWALEKFKNAKLENGGLQVSVLNVAATRFPLSSRTPAALANPRVPVILAEEIARITGVIMSLKLVGPSKVFSTPLSEAPAAAVLVEKINGSVVHWTFIETHGLGIDMTMALANTIGSLSGQFDLSAAVPEFNFLTPKIRASLFKGYEELALYNLKLRGTMPSRPIFATIGTVRFEQFVQVSGQRIKYIKAIGHEAAIMQIPSILIWLHSLSTSNNLAYGLFNSGPVTLISMSASKSWYVAVESDLDYRRALSPELEKQIDRIATRNNLALAFSERILGMIISSAQLQGPEAWAVYSIIGAAGVTKLVWDYHRRLEMQAASDPLAKVAVTKLQDSQSSGSLPGSCSGIMTATKKPPTLVTTSRVANL